MDDKRQTPAFPPRRFGRISIILLVCWILLAPRALAQSSGGPGGAPPASLERIELRKVGGQLNVRFQLSGAAPHQVVANIPKRVLVVKFSNTLPALPDGRRDFAFNDPFVVGVSFEVVGERDTWAKIKLRTPNLVHELVGGLPGHQVAIGFKPAPFGASIALTGVRLGPHRGGSRLVLDLTGLPEAEGRREGDVYIVRLKRVVPRLSTPPEAEDNLVALINVNLDGSDTLVRIRVKQPGIQPVSLALPGPPRLVFDFKPGTIGAAPRVTRPPPPSGIRPPPPETEDTPLVELFDRLQNPLIEANFRLALREFQDGLYQRANLLFLKVYDTIPDTELGIRAYFRAADAQYARHVASEATNYHGVITTYQAAIRAAEQKGMHRSSFLPKALFRIGRAYQRMGFHFESNVHYQILQNDYPRNIPHTQNSYYWAGLNFLSLEKPGDAVGSFMTFLDSEGDPTLEGPARYHLGDAYFAQKQYVLARAEFDRARKLNPTYPDTRPLLIFHMGETYYENANFEVARVLYRTLLDKYPDKNYTKLVGLRLGDFLRDEGKEEEAIVIYRQVIEKSPLEVKLRAKLRIANLMGNRPHGEELEDSLKLYEEIIAEGEGSVIVQEALLRKGLTLTLHGRHLPAIASLEKLSQEHPAGPFTRDNLIQRNIEENLKAQINQLFFQQKFWEAAKIYSRYKDQYFQRFRFPFTVFQIGRSHQELGLYDEAVGLYDELLKSGKTGPLEPLLHIQKVHAFLEKDDLGAAEAVLLRFLRDRKEDVYRVDAQMLLGKVYFTGRRYEEAEKSYRRIVQDFEKTRDPALGEAIAEASFELGQIYKELGRVKDALDSFRKAIASFHHPIQGANVPPSIILSHFRIGDMLFDLNQNQEAIEAYRRAIELYSAHDRTPWAHYNIGLIFRRVGEDKQALDEFTALVELAKKKPGELWEPLARDNQRDLMNKIGFRDYLNQ